MLIRKKITHTEPISEKELKMLEAAEKMPITFDEDSPELTEEDLKQFHRVSALSQKERQQYSVNVRLSPQAIHTAESLGKNYPAILSKILESVLANKETAKHYLRSNSVQNR